MEDRICDDCICQVCDIFGDKRLQWEPKKDDCYYVPDIIAVNKYRLYYYDNDDADKFFFENGFSCKTKAEAERLHDWIVEQVKNHRGNE